MARPIRRIVAGNDDNGKAAVLSDGPSPDVRPDPARPGFAATRLWVTDSSPAKVGGIRETLDSPHTLEPPPGGTICRVVEFPPEKSYIGRTTAADVRAYFEAMGSPGASTGGPGARHPYMQRTATVDFCYILDGATTLVLDTGEVHLKEGDTVIQRGTSHAWSNRSEKPCVILFSHHDASKRSRPTSRERPPGGLEGRRPPEVHGPTPEARKAFRRVVTGHDPQGRSRVLYDSRTPNVFFRPSGSCFNEMWTIEEMPAPLRGNQDFGSKGRPFSHSPPLSGCHWRVSYSPGPARETEADMRKERELHAEEAASGTERKDGARHPKMHRTPSIDYAACLSGERLLVLEDSDVVVRKGDVVIQLGNWHSWDSSSPDPSIMGYVMIGGEYG